MEDRYSDANGPPSSIPYLLYVIVSSNSQLLDKVSETFAQLSNMCAGFLKGAAPLAPLFHPKRSLNFTMCVQTF
jgi:hypothetical protein